MEGVDHVHVVEVGGRGLIGEVHRVLERQVPDGERLKLRVPGLDAALVLVVELREAGRHLAAARAGRRDDDERARRLDVVAAAVALVADDQLEVGGIIRDAVQAVDLEAEGRHALFENLGGGLVRVLRQRDAADVQAEAAENVDQADHVGVVGDAEVAAALVLFDVVRVDRDHDLGLVLELEQHLDLVVRLKARQHAGSVVIVEELAAEFEIQLAAELVDALADALRLQPDVLLTVKTDFSHKHTAPFASLSILQKSIKKRAFCGPVKKTRSIIAKTGAICKGIARKNTGPARGCQAGRNVV